MVHLDALWKMELAEGGITLITDEQFDFGLSSPSDSREEAPTEQARPVAHRLDLHGLQQEGVGCSRDRLAHWSPLSAEKLEEIMQEANRLAVQLERCSLREKEKAGAGLLGDSALSPAGESLAPVRLLHKERASPRSPRRETFVVKNSPVRALLPTVEPGMRLTPGRSPALCARAAPTPPHLRHRLGSGSPCPQQGACSVPHKETAEQQKAEPPGPAPEPRSEGPQAISYPAPPCRGALLSRGESRAPTGSKCR
uniref:Proline and serine rich coiled-coil 1 n=1 Tax=Pelodiscus sinensis TaxID=13735 RepID=K7FQM5_PELSI